MAAMVVEQVEQVHGAVHSMDVDEENPATPAKVSASSETLKEAAASNAAAVETPPKASQGDRVAAEDGDASGDEDDSNEALGLQLYYLLLRALFKELDLYSQPVEAGLLDPKKQLVVYHHAARLYDLRSNVLGALHGDLSATADLPVATQKVARKLRRKLQDQGQLERLMELNEKHVFGHDHAIRFVESNLPDGAKEHCVWLREKPHAQSDVVKHISPFRDVIKFHCFRNPLMLIEDHGLGLVLTIEKTFPVAYLVVSPFLRKPEQLAKHCWKGWQQIEESLAGQLFNFIGNDCDGWRTFIQRRANIISKGSLAIIQKALRLKPSKDGLDADAAAKLQDLMDEVDILRQRAEKAEETAGMKLGAESVKLEGKLHKLEDKNIDFTIVMEQLKSENMRMNRDIEEKEQNQEILEQRAQVAEQAVNAQREEQESLTFRCLQAEDRQTEAEAAKRLAVSAEKIAKHAEAEMAEKVRETKGESELLAGGVHEMMVELKKSEVSKKKAIAQVKDVSLQVKTLNIQVKKLQAFEEEGKKAIEQVKEASLQVKTLNIQVEKLQAAEEEAQEALGQMDNLQAEVEKLTTSEKKAVEQAQAKVALAEEAALQAELADHKASEAEQKRLEAEATLQVKTDALEQITASNVSLRTDAAMADDRVAAAELAKNEAVDEATRVREELKGREDEVKVREDEVKQLHESFEETKAMVVAAKEDVEKERVLTQEAERKAAEAGQSEIEMAAKLKVNIEQVESLNSTCGQLHEQVATLTETAKHESERAVSAEQAAEQAVAAAAQAAVEHSALLEVKDRTVESLMASNVSLRTEVVGAKSDVEEANAQIASHEEARNKAKESEAQVQKDLQARTEEIRSLNGSIKEHQALVVAAKEDAAAAHALKQEAEQKREESSQAEAETAARLKLKQDEVAHLTSSCGTLTSEVAKLMESVQQERERVAAAEQTTQEKNAQLEGAERTVQQMTADNTALRLTLISAKDKAESAGELVVAAEKASAAAIEREKNVKAKLCKKDAEIQAQQETIAELRAKPEPSEELLAEMASVRAEAEASKSQAAEAETLAVAAKAVEAETSARMVLKAEEAAGLVNECADLRAEAARLSEQAAHAEERAKEAELAEVSAKASLQFKIADVERVCATNVELRSDIIKARTEAEEGVARAEAADKHREKAVTAANRARDGAQAELRGKVAAAESMAAAMGAIRAEAQAARSAESAALEIAKKATEEAKSAEPAVKEAKKKEGQAMAKMKVKSEEASHLTSECTALRAEVALLREKTEGSTRAIKVLAQTCEKLKLELSASEAKHDWSKLQEPVPDFSSSTKDSDLTLEDMEAALTHPEEAAVGDSAAAEVPATQRRRVRSKGSVGKLVGAPSTGTETAADADVSETSSTVNSLASAAGSAITSLAKAVTSLGSSRRLRSKTAEPLANKRARVGEVSGNVDEIPDSSAVLDAD